jgi:hypothetical protein
MFYTFSVLFEKSSTLIDLMDLCKKNFCKRRKVTNLALTGWGCYTFVANGPSKKAHRLKKQPVPI